MNFNGYYEIATEYDADYPAILSAWNAWKAGATAMVELLFNFPELDEETKRELIGAAVAELMEGKE